MSVARSRILAGSLSALVLAAAAAWGLTHRADFTDPAFAPVAGPPVLIDSAAAIGAGRGLRASAPLDAPHDASLPPPRPETRGQIIERLSRTGDAQDAMRAYLLVTSCQTMRSMESQAGAAPPSEREKLQAVVAQLHEADPQECEGVTPALIAARVQNLRVAALAGVAGAASAYFLEGPAGDFGALAQRPDDPQVRAWKAEVVPWLVAAAAHGDEGAASTLAQAYRGGGPVLGADPVLHVTYAAEAKTLRLLAEGEPIPAAADLEISVEGLSPAEFDAARRTGIALAVVASVKPHRS